jgi:hypothetical protein
MAGPPGFAVATTAEFPILPRFAPSTHAFNDVQGGTTVDFAALQRLRPRPS